MFNKYLQNSTPIEFWTVNSKQLTVNSYQEKVML
jgi:hypothetical protein